jgi:hypothetical protein
MRHRSLALAALAWVLAECPGLAQGRGEYFALLDRYASGETTEAAAALSAWPESRVRAVVGSLVAKTPPTLLRRAIMLHTETAFVEVDDGRESFHLEVARSFVEDLLRSPYAELTARDFAGRWHAQAAIVYCTRNHEARARTEVNRGLTFDGSQRYVNLVAGALLEFPLGQLESNPRGTWNSYQTIDYKLRKQLHQAAQIYRGIIAKNPEFAEARLRFGWVLALNDSVDSAREQLQIVASRAAHYDVSYLAHMFLGSLHERARRPADAAREYEAARTVRPFQSSRIALMRLAADRGDRERVRSLATEIAENPVDDEEDPWSFYPLCATGGDLLDGLRAEAQRP